MVARLVARLALVIGLVLGGLLVPGSGPLTMPAGNQAAAIGLENESSSPRPDALLATWRPDAPDRAARDAAIAASLGATQVSAGSFHTCALTSAGGVQCWGYNDYGQLGDGNTTSRATPLDVFELTSGVASVSAGGDHTCAVMSTGGVKCWGNNYYGQLGDGMTTNLATPVNVVELTGAVAVSAGYRHTCALTSAGGVQCWGFNGDGELGDGTTMDRATPLGVVGLTGAVTSVSVGVSHTCAVTSAGGVQCWGDNSAGQLGDGTKTDSATPLDDAGLTSVFASVSAGGDHTCAVTSVGGVKCWGSSAHGQLGDGMATDSATPVNVVGLTSAVAVSTGFSHTCAVTSIGGVKCWGDNGYGQVGDGPPTDIATPVNVVGLAGGVAAVSAGWSHTCAVMSTGGVKCWGFNGDGELGDGTMTNRATPVDVVGFEGIYSISGRVTDGADAGLSGVTVTADGTYSATTAADGTYSIAGLPAGTHTITPSKSEYSFSPPSRTVTVAPSATQENFVGIFMTYVISGRVTDGADAGLAGVTVTADSTHYATTATTAADGTYSIAGLPVGTYTLAPSYTDAQQRNRTFSPASYNVTISMSAGSVTGKDFRLVDLHQRVYLPFVTKP